MLHRGLLDVLRGELDIGLETVVARLVVRTGVYVMVVVHGCDCEEGCIAAYRVGGHLGTMVRARLWAKVCDGFSQEAK